MQVYRHHPILSPSHAGSLTLAPGNSDQQRQAAERQAGIPGRTANGPFDALVRLTAIVMGIPAASVTVTVGQPAQVSHLSNGAAARRSSHAERSRRRRVLGSGYKLIIDDIRWNRHGSDERSSEPASMITWAGFPVRDPDGDVVGTLCVADTLPHRWSTGEVEVLELLAQLAGREAALQAALEHGAERAALARTLQDSLLPPRLPEIPGLQVAARYLAGGTGADVLGDFYDVFPSVRGSWGIAVGDVCGKGAPAAKSTALARYTLRAEAHRESRPSLILAALNRALLDWITDDPRFLTAIYATVRPTAGCTTVQVSSGGHPLALVRRADGRVRTLGLPGTLLGLFHDPELHDVQGLLRAGDSLILFTDGVTEARRHLGRDLYGDDRLRDLVSGLGGLSAGQIADAIQHATLAFGAGEVSDDTVVLVLQVPAAGTNRTAGRLPLPDIRHRSRNAWIHGMWPADRRSVGGRAGTEPGWDEPTA